MSLINRKYIFLIIITAVLALFAMFGISYLASTEKITVEINNVSELKLYKAKQGGNPLEFKPEKPSVTINKSGEYNIKKGYYIYNAQPVSNEYETVKGSFNTKDDKNLKIEPNYSNEKLNSLYSSEINSIQIALNTRYPNQMKDYKIEYGKLYIDGSWFAGYLIPNNGTDNLQVIMHKKGGVWEVQATPNITISKAQYPEIPYKVLESVNVRPF